MMEFFILFSFSLLNPFMFFIFLFLFSFWSLNVFSWQGLFFILDSYNFVILIFMSIFIFGLIYLSEKNTNLLRLTQILIFICVMFFIPSNIISLYIFFELSMFPILIMLLGYGSQIEKINSSYYLLFYAAFCSFPFLFVYLNLDFSFLMVYFDCVLSWELTFILTLAFMMKFPVYFLHLWLPKAHVEAPTTASMLLAGLLLKLGTAGFLRILKSISLCHINMWLFIAFIGMILAAFSCIFQSDAKALAAYSSITHMSFLLFSLLFINLTGKTSSLIMMVAHGYTSTLMFYFIGEFYHISSSRMLYFLNSFMNSSILMSTFFALAFLSNSGVPPSLSFVAEFMTISSGSILLPLSFYLIFIYFFVAFYYSLYIIVMSFMGKSFINFNNWNVGISFPLIFMCFNLFWFNIFY
nr:NADH dehydrogenase subunit 4 [Rhabditophanes sp. KR3021]